MQSLDLRSLEIFRTVATTGSVSKAAIKLNRVQSNISTRIKQLEQQLGKKLFLRHNRRLTLSREGLLLLPYAERMLQLSGEASQALAGNRPGGVLEIGAMESTAAARLPAVLSKLQTQYPDVRIELKTDTAGGLIDRLLEYDIEVALIAEPLSFDGIKTCPVFEEELLLVTPATIPVIEDLCEINGRTMIAFEAGCAYRRYLEEWLLENGLVPGGYMAVSSYMAILACVSAGTGFALVPKSVFEMISTMAEFRTYAMPGKLSRIKTLLAWRADYHSANLAALKELLPVIGGEQFPIQGDQ